MDLKQLKQLSEKYTVLYVEDDDSIAHICLEYLQKLFNKVHYAKDGLEGLSIYKNHPIDLIITDIQMPHMDGLEMAEAIKQMNNEQNILIISAYSDSEKLFKSIKIGLDGYILKPMDYNNLNEVLYKTVKRLKASDDVKAYESKLEELVEVKTNENLTLQLEQINNYEQTLFALIDIIESRDTYTGKHSVRVAQYSKLIAQELNYSQKACEEIYKAGILHDLGKVAIPDTLLLKPSSLNNDEYGLIKLHVEIGYHMLNQIPMFKNIAQIIYGHHERSDGTGYPNGKKASEILEESLIMAVADSFDAMTTNRIYKHRKTTLEALEELEMLQESHYSQRIVQAAKKVLMNIEIDESIHQNPISRLEQERFSYFYKDSLTHLYNEAYLDYILSKSLQEKMPESLYMIFLNHFGRYNKTHGWSQGNILLSKIAECLQKTYKDCIIFRIHGDDFVLISKDNKPLDMKVTCLDDVLRDTNIKVEFKIYSIQKQNIGSVNKLEEFL